MKNLGLLLFTVFLFLLFSCKTDTKTENREVTQDVIQKELELNNPDENHKALENFVGNWKTIWKVWDKPGGEPTWITEGKATFNWIMKGRFLQGNYSGEMMNTPYEGQLTIGYDKYENQYTARWINSFETTITDYKGFSTFDEQRNFKGLKLKGKASNCPVDQQDIEYTYAMRFESDDKMIEESWYKDKAGNDIKVLEVIYERIN